MSTDSCLNQNYKLCPELQKTKAIEGASRKSVDSCISSKEKPHSLKVKRTVFKIKKIS